MKLAFVSTTPLGEWVGGSNEIWYRTVLRAASAGHEVMVSFPYDGTTSNVVNKFRSSGIEVHFRKQGIELYSFPLRLILKGPLRTLFTRNQIQRIVERFIKFNANAVLINQGGSYTFFRHPDIVQLVERLPCPLFLFSHLNKEHQVFSDKDRYAIRNDLSKFKKVYFVSRRNMERVRHQVVYSRQDNFEVLRNMCKLRDFEPIPYPDNSFVQIAMVARLNVRHKGQDIALEALSDPIWRGREWHLNLYGSGQDQAYLIELAKYYGLTDRVTFRGHVEDIISIWKKCHVLLLTSINEGTPQSLIEAMFCGRVSIVTDVGDSAYLVEDGRTGFVIPAPTAALASRVMDDAWKNRLNWPRMGETAANAVRKYLDPDPAGTLLRKLTD